MTTDFLDLPVRVLCRYSTLQGPGGNTTCENDTPHPTEFRGSINSKQSQEEWHVWNYWSDIDLYMP